MSTCRPRPRNMSCSIFTVLRYAGVVYAMALCPSIGHLLGVLLNGWTDRAGFWQGGFYRPVLFYSLAVLDPRVGHTMDVLSPFIPVLCHSD